MRLNICEVCARLDGDYRLKWCKFCSLCGAWICQADLGNLMRRAAAALSN